MRGVHPAVRSHDVRERHHLIRGAEAPGRVDQAAGHAVAARAHRFVDVRAHRVEFRIGWWPVLVPEHRQAHGFAPQVRIGVHAVTATQVGRNFQGKGVHEAARIAALAEGGEILASKQTAGSRFPVSDPRTVTRMECLLAE